MSNQLAIASVTKTLQSVLRKSEVRVTTLSPDQAARDNSGARINIFLYHTIPNATWRNMDIPGRVRPGEVGDPPLALNLYYLLTAYGEDDSPLADQRILGRAMQVLHDRPVLRPQDIQAATGQDRDLGESDLNEQVDKVRVVPDTLNIEEMSRLWTTFQTQYRVSAAYQASVVLIESEKTSRVPMPVLMRGKDDHGVFVFAGLGACLNQIEYRANSERPNLPSANVGSTISVLGTDIPATGVTIVVRDPKLTNSRRVTTDVIAELKPKSNDKGVRMLFDLDPEQADWVAGLMTLEVQYKRQGRDMTSNAIPLAIAPKILVNDAGSSIVAFQDNDGDRKLLNVTLEYPNGPDRRVLILLNRIDPNDPGNATADSRNFFQIPVDDSARGPSPSTATFDISNVQPGRYWARLRVDGVDSLLLVGTKQGAGLKFDERQQVVIEEL